MGRLRLRGRRGRGMMVRASALPRVGGPYLRPCVPALGLGLGLLGLGRDTSRTALRARRLGGRRRIRSLRLASRIWIWT